MKWLVALRRMFHLADSAPPTSGDTSVLFCLYTTSPMTLDELQQQTTIPFRELRLVLDRLVSQNRVGREQSLVIGQVEADRDYWIINKSEH